jgi:hypothetical protein
MCSDYTRIAIQRIFWLLNAKVGILLNMTNYTDGESVYLAKMVRRLVRMRNFLNNAGLENDKDKAQWLECLLQMKVIQGNSNNDVSFIACLMAKDYLAAEFDIETYDVAAKPQGAAGLDIDIRMPNGERIIGEIKTTIPYSGARGNLGANQKDSFEKDFVKLNTTPAAHKFFFVTDSATLELMRRKYTSKLPGVRIVILPSNNESVQK